MHALLRLFPGVAFLLLALSLQTNVQAQCGSCSAITIPVNLSAVTDTVWMIDTTRNGNCCTGTNCIRFDVTLNPASDLLSFDVLNPAPSGAAFYQINCGPQISIGTPACILGMTTVCITYCKPGGDSPDYVITATRTVQGSNDITVRQGCTGTLSVTGLQIPSITWTSINPAPQGAYNSYLSCTSGCASTNITPTSSVPSFIDYMVSGSPNTSCPGTSRDTIRVNVVPAMTVSISPANPVVCSGGPGTATITANPVGGAPPYTYSWSTGATTQAISVGPGTYTVNVSDQTTGCPPITATVTVAAVTTPSAPVTGSNSPVCLGSPINLTAGTISGATYSWTGPNGFTSTTQNPTIPVASSADAGTYSVTATVSGCTGPAGTTSVTVNPIPSAPTASSNSPVCTGSTLNLSASSIVGAIYSWTGPNGFTSSSQNPAISGVTAAAAGTYSVTATVGGCASPIATVSVTVNTTPAAPTASSNSPVCAGSTLNLSASNVVGATYSWTGPNGFTSSTQNPSITGATTAASGTYSVTATVGGCTSTAGTVSVTVNPIPAAPTASSNSPICDGSTLNLSASSIGGATYSWTGPNGFTSSTQNPSIAGATTAASGTYSVTATVAGCTGSAGTVSVTVNPTPAAPSLSSNSPVCSGTTLSLSTAFVAGATYSWTGPNGFTSSLQNPSITNVTTAAAGTYSLTITVAGCTSAAGTVSVTVNATPAAPAASSNSPICAGSTLNLSASNIGGATYSWTGPNGFTSSTQNPSIPGATTAATGTYSVTATVGGCTGNAGTAIVTVNPIPATPSPSSNSPVCTGTALSLSTSAVSGATYSWTGPNGFTSSLQNPSITNVTTAAAGTYSLTVTVAGCTSVMGTVSVTVNTTPAAPTASSNSPICAGSTLNLSASNIGGATYSWTGPNGFTSSTQNPSIAGATTAATGTYSVTATVAGCTGTAGTVSVTVNPIPATPSPSSNSPVCTGNTLTLSTGTVSGATYSWTGPNGFTSSLQNPSITNVTLAAAGTYSLTITVAGCTGSAGTVSVTVNATPAAPTASSNSPLCAGSTLNLSASSIVGATYSWTGPNGFTSSTQNPSIAGATTAATGTYSVTAIVAGCTGAAGTVSVTINPIPATPAPSSNSPICTGNTLNLSTAFVAGATYSWTGPNGFTSSSQNPSIPGATTAASGTYSVTVTVNGCTSAAGTVSATVNATPATPVVSGTTPICSGNTLQLTADTIPGATWSWAGPNGFTSTQQNPAIPNVTVAASGTYTVTANNGCASVPSTVTIVVNATPATPSASSNGPLCTGSTLNLGTPAVSGATYSWTGPNGFTSSSQNPSIPGATLSEAGTYSVTVTVNGCTSSAGTVNVAIDTPAIVSAGTDQTVCANNAAVLLGASSSTGSGTWTSTGSGTFSPSVSTPNATYTPSNADTAAGSVTLTFTSTNNGACPAVNDQMIVTLTDAPTASAGVDQTVCANNNLVTLGASFTIAGGVNWTTSGDGSFSPSFSDPNAIYTPGSADIAAGTVTLTVTTTGNGGCIPVTDQLIVTITPAPVPNAGANTAVCINNPNVSLNGSSSTGTGTWSTSGSGTFSPNANTLNATYVPSTADTTAGTVTLFLTTTNNGNCLPEQDTMIVTFTQPPIVLAGSDVTVCANNAAAALSGSSSTGSGTWTSSGSGTFSPNANTLNATYNPSAADTAAGSVTLTLTSTNNGGCIAVTDQLVVTITDAPTANAGIDQSVCSNNAIASFSGSFTIASGGVWSTTGSGTFSPSNTAMNVTYTASAADTAAGNVLIILTTTGNGLCNAVSDTMVLTIFNAPNTNAGPNTISCLSSPNTPLGGFSGTGSGTWTTLGSGTFSPNANTLNATYIPSTADTTAGSVTLILTSTNNGICLPVSDTMTIQFAPIPAVTTGPDQTVCANNALISVSGASSTGSGIWTSSGSGTFSPSNTDPNATYTPSPADTAAGTVTLIFTATNACTPISDTTELTITPAPNVNGGPDLFTCANNPDATILSTVSGGATSGAWSTSGSGIFSPDNTSLNVTYSPDAADIAAGSVWLVLISTNNGNCLAESDSVLLTITQPPAASAGADLQACANNPAQLNGTVTGGNGTGIWTTTNGAGTFSPSDTTLNATYTPSNADTSVSPVMVILTSTNNGGCFPASDTLLINVLPGPTVTAGADAQVCANNASVTLNGSVLLAGGGVWTSSGGGTFLPDSVTLNATYVPDSSDIAAGAVTLYLTTTGNGLCNAVSDSLAVTITPAPAVNAGSSQIICTGTASVALNGSVAGGSASGQWSMSGDGTFSPNDSTLNATYIFGTADTANGSVTLYLVSTNNGNCLAETDSVQFTITPVPVALAGADTNVCVNSTGIVLGGQIIGTPGSGVWTSSGSGSFVPDSTALNATYIPGAADTAAGTVTLILSSTNACLVSSDTLTIAFMPAPAVNAGSNVLICAGATAALNGSAVNSASVVWTTSGDGVFMPSDTVLNPVYVPGTGDTASGSVTITLSSTGNAFCSGTGDSLVITINSKPNAAFTTGSACAGVPLLLTDQSTVSNGSIVSWDWSAGSDTSSLQHPSFTFVGTGTQTITLTVATAAGCADTMTQTVYVNVVPSAFYTAVTTCPGTVTLTDGSSITQGGIVSWNWNFGDSATSTLQHPTHTYADTGTYAVFLTVTSDSGCTASYADSVYLVPCAASEVNPPAVPTAFTPNGDGNNDVLYVKGGPFTKLSFRVYNEWGNMIFQSESQSAGWDGSYKGKLQPGGTYVWTLTGTTADGIDVNAAGEVTIIR